MVSIKKMLLNQNQSNVPNRSMNPRYITVHNTANSSRGANALMHARYLRNGAGGRQTSWHYTVDDTEIYQHLLDTQQGWHAGDGGGRGNTQSIGIEICENSDGDFSKAVKHAQWLIRKLMNDHDIPLANVVPHKNWSGKNCPRLLLSQWNDFKSGISSSSSSSGTIKQVSKPKERDVPKPSPNSLVDYLKSIGEDSSFNNRSKLAKKYGISNYRGTASQNLDLLNKISQHHMPAENTSSIYKGNSIVDYLNSVGINSSFTNRKKLAAKYGIRNYSGTASQNAELLRLMRLGENTIKSSTYKGNSLVDYLNSIGENSSFKNRSRLATKYGITGYKGSASQNTSLLKKLRGF